MHKRSSIKGPTLELPKNGWGSVTSITFLEGEGANESGSPIRVGGRSTQGMNRSTCQMSSMQLSRCAIYERFGNCSGISRCEYFYGKPAACIGCAIHRRAWLSA